MFSEIIWWDGGAGFFYKFKGGATKKVWEPLH